MLTKLASGENIIITGPASLKSDRQTTAGMLYLTNLRLIFESCPPAQAPSAAAIALDEITAVEKGWSKLFGILPLAPNTIRLCTGRAEYRLTLFGRQQWFRSLEQARRNAVGCLAVPPKA